MQSRLPLLLEDAGIATSQSCLSSSHVSDSDGCAMDGGYCPLLEGYSAGPLAFYFTYHEFFFGLHCKPC